MSKENLINFHLSILPPKRALVQSSSEWAILG